MELFIYDLNLNLAGILDTATSVIWHRVYFAVGDFVIQSPATERALALIQKQWIVTKPNTVEFGIIESVIIEQQEDGEVLKATGRFGSSLFARRILFESTTLTTTVETAMRTLISENAIVPTITDRVLPNIILGTFNAYSEVVSFQATYKNLLTKLQELSATSGIGFRLRFDPTVRKMIFETYKALDRSIEQSANPKVIFSNDYDNLLTSMYQTSDQEYSNVALVGGEGEGLDRKLVVVGSGSGLNRYEVFINAKEQRMEEGMTETEYNQLLAQKGAESLLPRTEYFEGNVLMEGNVVYKTDYDLGDIVTIENNRWGKRIHVRMNEITEVSDENGESVIPVFGSPLLSMSELVKKGTDTSGSSTGRTFTVIPNRAIVSDSNGNLVASEVTAVELNTLDGVTSAIQPQLNAKQAAITGAATTLIASNLTVNKALQSDANGKVAASNVTNVELGYLAGVTSPLQTQLSNLWNLMYPIGSIYLSVLSTSPAALFGGTWVALGGRFLLGADGTYPAGSLGGAATHVLAANEMPVHTHIQDAHSHFIQRIISAASGSAVYIPSTTGSAYNQNTNAVAATNQNAGGGAAHNNMPPYLAVYMWKRTA